MDTSKIEDRAGMSQGTGQSQTFLLSAGKTYACFAGYCIFPFVAYDLLRPQGIQPLDISTDPFYPQVKHYF